MVCVGSFIKTKDGKFGRVIKVNQAVGIIIARNSDSIFAKRIEDVEVIKFARQNYEET